MKENYMQYLFDGFSKENQKQRTKTQMTLGDFIEILEQIPKNKKIDGLINPHSYRGYYSDLAFEKSSNKKTVKETIEMCKKCLGEKFIGYKGGDFYMTKNTPIWNAFYGMCGKKIINLNMKTGKFLFEDND